MFSWVHISSFFICYVSLLLHSLPLVHTVYWRNIPPDIDFNQTGLSHNTGTPWIQKAISFLSMITTKCWPECVLCGCRGGTGGKNSVKLVKLSSTLCKKLESNVSLNDMKPFIYDIDISYKTVWTDVQFQLHK